jgi:hypothetical protein
MKRAKYSKRKSIKISLRPPILVDEAKGIVLENGYCSHRDCITDNASPNPMDLARIVKYCANKNNKKSRRSSVKHEVRFKPPIIREIP